jgi:endonuclease YncB( thermonuclease family)
MARSRPAATRPQPPLSQHSHTLRHRAYDALLVTERTAGSGSTISTTWQRLSLLAGAVLVTLGLSASRASAFVDAAPPPGGPWLVTEVVDGDTLHVASGDTVLTVRLIGVNAPERDECWSAEATEALVELVGAGPVWLTTDVSDVDQYGRALRYVINANLDDVGALLVEQGHAIARSYPPDTANDERYALLQAEAQRDERGLWAPAACGSPAGGATNASVAIDVHFDAAGPDNENLNDEWVRFTNTGSEPLALDGWTVKDESASHRYTFGDLVLAPGAAVTLRTGCGIDTSSELFWCNESSGVWNNEGDTVFLLDPVGNVAATERY